MRGVTDIRSAGCAMLVVAAGALLTAQSPSPGSIASPGFDAVRANADAARTAGHLDEAVDLYRRGVRLRPSWAEGQWYLGTISYELGRYPTCRDAFGELVRLQPGNGAAWAFKGLCEFGLKAYRTALANLNTAHAVHIGDPKLIPVARYHRAILLARAGEFERASQVWAGFARAGNISPEVIQGMGIAVLRIARLPEELSPEQRDLATRAGRATVLAQSDGLEAEREYEDLVRAYPATPNVHYVYALFLLRDRPERALEQLREELRISPRHAPAMIQIAQELLKRGDRETATHWAKQAVLLAPRNFVARRVLGQAKLDGDDVRGAIAELELAVKLEPDSPSAHYTLARAYQRAGRAADAERERATFTRLERLQQELRGAVDR
jgi:tetratricopeptide (TPR) repeat protein